MMTRAKPSISSTRSQSQGLGRVSILLGLVLIIAVSSWFLLSRLESELPPLKQFVQLSSEGKTPTSLDIAISKYKGPGGVRVALVSAVHIADKEHYAQLNQELGEYDSVLYELIGPQGAKPDPALAADNPYSVVQKYFGSALDASFQLEEVDYQKATFVHADVSVEDVAAEMNRRQETPQALILKFLTEILTTSLADDDPRAEPISNLTLSTIFLRPQRFRSALAASLAQSSSGKSLPGLNALSPYLVDLRNDRALEVLEQEIAKGKKNIAIYYGAAHMTDIEEKLILHHQMKRVGEEWLVAWDLTRPIEPKNPLTALGSFFAGF